MLLTYRPIRALRSCRRINDAGNAKCFSRSRYWERADDGVGTTWGDQLVLETAEEAAVVDDFANDVGGGFFDDEALAGGQGDHGVRGGFDELDKLGVEHESLAVEAGEGDHGYLAARWWSTL